MCLELVRTSVGASRVQLNDYAAIKYNPAGTLLWIARYDGPGQDMDDVCDMEVDDLGNVYVTGYGMGIGPPTL